jgi:hypothetical protein
MSVGFVAKCTNLPVYKSAYKGHASVYNIMEPPFNFPSFNELFTDPKSVIST